MTTAMSIENIRRMVERNGYKEVSRWQSALFNDQSTLNEKLLKMIAYTNKNMLQFLRDIEYDQYTFKRYRNGVFEVVILKCTKKVTKNTDVFLLVLTDNGSYISFNLWQEEYLTEFLKAANKAYIYYWNCSNSDRLMGAGYSL